MIEDFSTDKCTRFFRATNPRFTRSPDNRHALDDDYFKKIHILGKIPLSTIDGLVCCTLLVDGNLTARSGKKKQYEKAKSILKAGDNRDCSAGIFIFHDAEGHFRFSLVYGDVERTKRTWSNFRRFTYFVSRDRANATFITRIGAADFSALDGIKEAFSVEPVTKEFYQRLEAWYYWAIGVCRFPQGAEATEGHYYIPVIRLITRIVFIWFMRERRLIPAELFEREFAQITLRDSGDSASSYYRAILQNLFFATLNTPQLERRFRAESSFQGHNRDFGNTNICRFLDSLQHPANLRGHLKRVPFLNGGLFECLDNGREGRYVDGFTEREKDQAHVPNELFFRQATNDGHEGLFSILSAYNFTIDENSLHDQEVALDPELLGQIFENLLASFNPEGTKTERKASGSYYTPREIVDYMATEALSAYFRQHAAGIADIDAKLATLFSRDSSENPFSPTETKALVGHINALRIVDPAVGSGAFPMGVLNLLVHLLDTLDGNNKLWKEEQVSQAATIPDAQLRGQIYATIEDYFNTKDSNYGRKLYLIQHCLYGVDNKPIAIEIAKLRFFISLLVDERIDDGAPNRGIAALPNLDFKLRCGDSLLGLPHNALLDSKLQAELEDKKDSYFNESDHTAKRRLRNEIGALFGQLVHGVSEYHVERIDADFDFEGALLGGVS